jgi:RecA/RadA recombinase
MKPIDVSKFRTAITKSINGISIGFRDPTVWLSTGNYALNYLISSDFFKGVPLGKSTMFAGQSGSGKSFIVSGNLAREAQKQGVFVVMIDTENALDEAWLKALGVDTSEEKLLKINAAMIDDVAKIISDFMKDFKATYSSEKQEDRPKVLFIVDSLGMLMTPTDVNQFEAGEMKGDMGRKPKALKALVTNVTNMFGEYDVGLVTTNHSYASQDMFDPDDKISGGQGVVYAASIVVAMQKRKLKEDAEGNKTSDVTGIRAAIKVMKSRYAKPFEAMEIKIPWDEGMDPYSGLTDLFESKGLLNKEGNKLAYVDEDGVITKLFRKEYDQNKNGILDRMMAAFMKNMANVQTGIDNSPVEEEDMEVEE